MLTAPIPDDEAQRLAVLEAYRIYGTDPEEEYDQIGRLLTAICGTQSAVISIVGQDELSFKSRINFDASRGPRDISFCGHAMFHNGVFVIEDAAKDPRFADNPVVKDGGMRFYAGAPLISAEGLPIGTLCTLDDVPHQLSQTQLDAVGVLAQQVMAHMELRRQHFQLQHKANILEKHSLLLEQQAEELRQLNASKDRFFSIIAHDLRAPFQGILGFAELLDTEIDEMSQGEIRNIASYLHDTADSAFKLLENLLHWSMVDSGNIVYTPRVLLIETLFDLIEGSLSASAHHKNIRLHFRCECDLSVYADENMLRSAIRNLVSNAIKFTDQYGQIDVEAKRVDDHILLQVSDSGVGMTAEQVDKLFVFEQTQSTSGTSGETGTGLGLMLCQQFVQHHQGRIDVQSTLGKGTVFRIHLPIKAEQPSEQPVALLA